MNRLAVSASGKDRVLAAVNRIHLIYLGLMPPLATFALVRTYGHRAPALLLSGGIVVTAVYLAASYSYTMLPGSIPASLWALLDGPLFALTARASSPCAWSFVIEGFLIDAVALWLAILALTLVSDAPSPWQRGASFLLALIALGSLISLFFPYLVDTATSGGWSLCWIAVGVVETTFVLYRLLDAGKPVRLDDDVAGVYIAVMVVIWVIAMSAGVALHSRL